MSGKTIWHQNKGFINYFIGTKSAQITLLIVNPKYHRIGIGTKLLEAAIEDIHFNNIYKIFIGAGTGRYFWPGIPENLPKAISFFRSAGYKKINTNLDLILNLSSYKQVQLYNNNIRIKNPMTKDNVIEFENRHFPHWVKHFLSAKLQNILIAELDKEIVGSVIILDEEDFLWSKMVPSTGGFGCLGVAKGFRNKGIGMALSAKSTEITISMGLRNCYLGWTYLDKYYGKLGYQIWKKYSYGTICSK